MKFGPRRILPLLIALFTVLSAPWIMAGGRNAEGFSALLMFRVNKLLSDDGYNAGSFAIGMKADEGVSAGVAKHGKAARKSVDEGKSVSVRLDLGGQRKIK